VLAFSLVGNRAEASPRGTYFAPIASGTDREDNTVYFPDIAGTPSSVISHWSGRAKSVAHPILKSCYADLAWKMPTVMGELRRDVEMARLAIDTYLASTSSDIRPQILDRSQAPLRAIDLVSWRSLCQAGPASVIMQSARRIRLTERSYFLNQSCLFASWERRALLQQPSTHDP